MHTHTLPRYIAIRDIVHDRQQARRALFVEAPEARAGAAEMNTNPAGVDSYTWQTTQ